MEVLNHNLYNYHQLAITTKDYETYNVSSENNNFTLNNFISSYEKILSFFENVDIIEILGYSDDDDEVVLFPINPKRLTDDQHEHIYLQLQLFDEEKVIQKLRQKKEKMIKDYNNKDFEYLLRDLNFLQYENGDEMLKRFMEKLN